MLCGADSQLHEVDTAGDPMATGIIPIPYLNVVACGEATLCEHAYAAAIDIEHGELHWAGNRTDCIANANRAGCVSSAVRSALVAPPTAGTSTSITPVTISALSDNSSTRR